MSNEEIFDSVQLESCVISMIREGKRNFAVNLTPLDYIYSDAMNKLLAINRQVLDVNGRLVLLGPQPEVREILERAGIHNFLKIYATETDLARSSDDIIKQTQSISLDAIKAIKAGIKPKSDFEDFRTEMDRAFEEPTAGSTTGPRASHQAFVPPPMAPIAQQPVPPAFMPQPQRTSMPPQPPIGFPPVPPQSMPRPVAPQFGLAGPMPPQFAQQQYQDMGATQYYQQPAQAFNPQQQFQQQPIGDFRMPPQVTPMAAPAPAPEAYMPPPQQSTPYETKKTDGEDFADFGIGGPATHKVPAAEQTAPTSTKTTRISDEDRRSRDGFEEETPRKKFPVGALVVIALILAIAGAGVFLFQKGIINFSRKDAGSHQQTMPSVPPQIPQLQVEEMPKAVTPEEDALAQQEAEQEKMEAAAAKKEPVRTAVPRRAAVKPAQTPAPAQISTPVPVKSAPVESANNQLFITSLPPGATVKIDGDNQGTTPFAWPNPTAYGQITIEVEKNGFQSQKKRVEYTGGILKEHFVLEREAPPPLTTITPPPAAQERTTPAAPPAPAAQQTPRPLPAAAQPISRPAPEAPKPAAPAAQPTGEAGSIFIASIPPVADVFMDGAPIGKTNVEELKVTAGTHTMRFVKGTKEISKVMTFQPGKNASQMVRIP